MRLMYKSLVLLLLVLVLVFQVFFYLKYRQLERSAGELRSYLNKSIPVASFDQRFK